MNARKWLARLLAMAAVATLARWGSNWMGAAGDAFAARHYVSAAAWSAMVLCTWRLWRTWIRTLFVPTTTVIRTPTLIVEISGDVADEAALREAIKNAVQR